MDRLCFVKWVQTSSHKEVKGVCLTKVFLLTRRQNWIFNRTSSSVFLRGWWILSNSPPCVRGVRKQPRSSDWASLSHDPQSDNLLSFSLFKVPCALWVFYLYGVSWKGFTPRPTVLLSSIRLSGWDVWFWDVSWHLHWGGHWTLWVPPDHNIPWHHTLSSIGWA